MTNILRWNKVKTRKPHHCFGCGDEYPKDTKMINASYADSSTVYSCYWCDTCVEYMHRYFECGDDTGYGEIKENDLDGWNELNEELMNGEVIE